MKKAVFFLIFSVTTMFADAQIKSFDELAYPFPVKTVTVGEGINLAYVDEGGGPAAIIFVHGLGSYLPAWKKNIENLKDHYRCIALDLPGYGRSSKGNYAGSMTFYARTVKQFAEALGLKKIIIAGHSMGGQIAITAALAYPDLVEKLVLVSPAGLETFNKGERQWFRDVLTPDAVRLTTVEQIRVNLANNFYNLPEDARFMIDDRIAMRSASDFAGYCFANSQSVKGMVDEPVYDFLPEVRQPTLVIYGEFDNLIPNPYLHGGRTADVMEPGAKRMVNATAIKIEKAGHFVHFEQAEAVNQAIRDFLR